MSQSGSLVAFGLLAVVLGGLTAAFPRAVFRLENAVLVTSKPRLSDTGVRLYRVAGGVAALVGVGLVFAGLT